MVQFLLTIVGIITKTASKLLCQFARNRFLLKWYTLMLYTHNIEQANEGKFLILFVKNYLFCNRAGSGFFEDYYNANLIVIFFPFLREILILFKYKSINWLLFGI